LTMAHRDIHLNFDRTFGVTVPVNGSQQIVELPAIETNGAKAAIMYDSDPVNWRQDIVFIGGVGLLFPYGVTFAVGAGAMLIKRAIMRPSV
jgi:hypothetical protein